MCTSTVRKGTMGRPPLRVLELLTVASRPTSTNIYVSCNLHRIVMYHLPPLRYGRTMRVAGCSGGSRSDLEEHTENLCSKVCSTFPKLLQTWNTQGVTTTRRERVTLTFLVSRLVVLVGLWECSFENLLSPRPTHYNFPADVPYTVHSEGP